MKVIKEDKALPIKMWLDDIDENALAQAKNLARLPFAFKHIALMPDCHMGYGMPIGGVMATEDVIVPNAVGVDIGCGMCAVKTSLKVKNLKPKKLKKIMGKIREKIPVGFNHHREKQDERFMPVRPGNSEFCLIVDDQYQSALTQIGTLGGGNHFIEIQKDTDDNIWIMIHSGSRNLGLKVASYYNKLAMELNTTWFTSVPNKQQLAFLPIKTTEAKRYLQEMQYCIDFALNNRKLMMERVMNSFSNSVEYEPLINIAHNYASKERHFGKNVWVHRKGATFAGEGNIGIIPGSQGTSSYIVKGLGNRDSFMSCSHGAGRKMGRNDARKNLNLKDEVKLLEDQGIIHSILGKADLDEASGAYKSIEKVMKNQEDLVEIVTELKPIAVIKG